MNIAQQRADLAAVLTGADLAVGEVPVQVYPYLPESPNMPSILIEPADPWISSDEETFGSYRIGFELTISADVGTNEKITADLDQLVNDVIDALAGAYDVAEVSAPFAYQTNTAMYLAARATVTDNTNLKED